MFTSKNNKQSSWLSAKSNRWARFVVEYVNNPINFLYTGLGLVVVLLTFEHSFSSKPLETGYFSGKIIFGNEGNHRINTKDVSAQIKTEMGEKVLVLTATESRNLESIYLKIFKIDRPGTYFIPGDGEMGNIGNLIKNLKNYQEKDNFYESTLPNKEGVQNGVGRVNITSISATEVEGELILIGNNTKGEQAVLETAKFKIPIQ